MDVPAIESVERAISSTNGMIHRWIATEAMQCMETEVV